VRYALSLAARRRALARGKKDSLRVLQGEWQCYQQNLSFVFLFQLVTRYLVRGSLQSIFFFHYSKEGWLGFPQKGKCHIPELHKGKVDSFLSHLGK
jgi:hypothetical protein